MPESEGPTADLEEMATAPSTSAIASSAPTSRPARLSSSTALVSVQPSISSGSASPYVPESFRSELYYLIVQFLSSSSSTSQSAAALKDEIARSGLLQPRYDYLGNAHPKQLGDVANEVGPMPPEYLLDLCFRLCSISQQQHSRSAGATANGIRTLLGHRLLGLASAASPLESSLVRPSRPGVFHALANRQNGRTTFSSSSWHGYMARQMKQLRRTLGHLAAVYCMIFDRTGQIVITGADDFLVKSWRISDGRLVYTFRGAASEISDLAISHDNRLLAAGSCDKVIRVWCLHTAVPITVLCKHTGMITAIHFCPYSEDDSQFYLASTSGDGTVSFWRFYYNEHDTATFDLTPTRYHEKIRPGLSQMICGSFSHGGVFFCVGSADHNVRVYQMNCPEGPQRILEEEAHDDRVDSIQWCNQPDLRFVSGSKDGTARIWSFQRQKWRSIVLNMATGDNKENTALRGKSSANSSAPTTSTGDSRNRSASSSLNPQHHQQQSQQNGNNEKRVTMVAWSLDDSLVITAVSDNTLKLWDSRSGHLRSTLYAHEDEIFVLENHPIAPNLLLSSAHDGQIIIWDLSTNAVVFRHRNSIEHGGFAAVYDAKWSPDGTRVAATDSHGHILFIGHGCSDQYDKLPVELFFHTDYRPLVRDSLNGVVDEQTHTPPHLLPPPFLVDSEGSPYPAYVQRFVPGRENLSEREALLPSDQEQQPGAANANADAGEEQPRPRGDAPGPSAQAQQHNNEHNNEHNDEAEDGHNAAAPHYGTWRCVVKSDSPLNRQVEEQMLTNRSCAVLEMAQYMNELTKVLFDHESSAKSGSGAKERRRKTKNSSRGNRSNRNNRNAAARAGTVSTRSQQEVDSEEDDSDSEEEEGEQVEGEEDETSDCSLDESDFSSMEDSTTEASSEHSDWGSDDEQAAAKNASSEAKSKKSKPKSSKDRNRKAAQKCNEKMVHPGDISDDYVPSAWLSESLPKKSPYFPQLGDVLMYFKQGHERYVELVKTRNTYQIKMKEQLWMKKISEDATLVKVTGIKFEIRPPRLCVLKLSMLNQHTHRESGESFTIKYHDMNDVVDFLILFETYKSSKGKHWKHGDRIRCQIDDKWWKGTVQKVECHDASKKSPFLSISCHWDNGEKECLSPWDIEALDGDSAEIPDGTSVPPEQLKSALYQPTVEEWNDIGQELECRRISEALEAIMSLAIAEPFNYPVDLTAYPDYMLDVEYPMDLSLVKARLDNRFYRRIDAVLYDVKYIAVNAKSYNQPRSDIVRNASIISQLTSELVSDPVKTTEDVSAIYHRLVGEFRWSEDDDDANKNDDNDDGEENDEGAGTSREARRRRHSSKTKSPPNLNPKKWKHDCNELLNEMFAHQLSVPFREPVSEIEFPDYHRCITTPMDLATVREILLIGEQSTPLDFQKDVRLIFKNSKEYNTDPKSKILSMTIKLEDWFEQRIHPIVHEWKLTNRRLTLAKRKHKAKKKDGSADSSKVDYKGKGKGRGKGESNRIRSRRQAADSEDDTIHARDISDEDDDSEDQHEDDDDEDSEPKSKPKPSRRARAKTKSASEESNDDDEAETATRRSASARRKKPSTAPAPVPIAASTSGVGTRGPMSSSRLSSRAPKPPMRYRENLDEAEEPSTSSGRAFQRACRQNTRRNLREESESDVETANAARGGSRENGNGSSRPQRARKQLRREQFLYSGDEMSSNDDDDDAPLAAKRARRSPTEAAASSKQKETKAAAQQNGVRASTRARRTSAATDDDDDDDVPLARKRARKQSGNSQQEQPQQEQQQPKTKQAVSSDPRVSRIADPKKKTAARVPSTSPESNAPRGKSASAKRKFARLEEDSAEDSSSPSHRRSRKKGSSKKGKREETESEFEESESDEETEEEEVETTEESDEEEEEDESDEETAKPSRRGQGRGSSSSRSRRRDPEPKRNLSRRAAQAIDSESEHTSARRPTRTADVKARPTAASAAEVKPASAKSALAPRRAAAKRSYFEGDSDDDDGEGRRGGGSRANRRVAATQQRRTRARIADSDSEEEEEEEEDEDEES